MLKKIYVMTLLAFTSYFAVGQTVGDAVRYSYWQQGGSARYLGSGSSMGALGGDYSAVISNPAGLATYRKPEITFTPYFGNLSSASTFNQKNTKQSAMKIGVGQAAAVFTSVAPDEWKSVNFSIGYNQLADLRQKYYFTSTDKGSIVNHFLELAQGYTKESLGGFDAALASETDLIYIAENAPNNSTWSNDVLASDQTLKTQKINNKGSIGELNFSLAGNYEHKWYLGASIGIPFVYFSQFKTYEESDVNGTISHFNNLKFSERLSTQGAGFNLKIGAIYRPIQALRIGASFHSPSWITLTDGFSSSLTSNMTYNQGTATENTRTFSAESPNGKFEYMQYTPMKAIGNVAFLIQKRAFITAEVEWINYAFNQYNFDPEGAASSADLEAENATNQSIEELLQPVVNLKVGGELVFLKNFRARAGYALYGDPFKNNTDTFNGKQLSLGLGYRTKGYFIDAAYIHKTHKENYIPFKTQNYLPLVKNQLDAQYFVITVGLKLSNDTLGWE